MLSAFDGSCVSMRSRVIRPISRFWIVLICCALAVILQAQSSTPFVTSKTLGTVRNDYSGWVGMAIQIGSSDITANSLGRIVVAGNSGTHTVKIADSTGTDVAGGSVSVSMSGGTPGSFVYGNLASPVTLSAGATYYILSQEASGGDQWYDYNTTVQTTSVASVTSAAFGSGSPYSAAGSAGQTMRPWTSCTD